MSLDPEICLVLEAFPGRDLPLQPQSQMQGNVLQQVCLLSVVPMLQLFIS